MSERYVKSGSGGWGYCNGRKYCDLERATRDKLLQFTSEVDLYAFGDTDYADQKQPLGRA